MNVQCAQVDVKDDVYNVFGHLFRMELFGCGFILYSFSSVAVHFESRWMMERDKTKRKVSISANEARLPGRHSVAWTFRERRV